MMEKIMNPPRVIQRWKKNESQINEESHALLKILMTKKYDEVQNQIPQKFNRSKYKGRTVYHHGNKIKFLHSLNKINNNSHQSEFKFYQEIVQEIEEDKHDEGFFGHLEADDQQYE
jgi:hypothetical protein